MRDLLRKIFSTRTRNVIRSLQPSFFFRKSSFSQAGEDIIIEFLLEMLVGKRPIKYLDIGANHPFHLSNTALLYKHGGSGFLIEPDPYFARLLRKERPRDEVVQSGVHFSGEDTADFYIMDSPTLNTFSEHEMMRYLHMGHQLVKTIKVNLIEINSILELVGSLDFLNLDIEGLDLAILEMIDWKKYRPVCICVESIAYEKNKEPEKLETIINLMHSKDYILYADTFINSIFVDKNRWKQNWNKASVVESPYGD